MSRENGFKLLTFIGSMIGSFLAITYAIYQLVYAPLSYALTTEVGKREASDNMIMDKVSAKLDRQANDINEIKIMIARISK